MTKEELNRQEKDNKNYFLRGRDSEKETASCVVCEKKYGHLEYKGKKLCNTCLDALKNMV